MEYITIIVFIIFGPAFIKMLDRSYKSGKTTELGKDIKSFLNEEA